MAAALGALFPSPFLAVLMITELCSNLPKTYMETTIITTIPAMVSFAVFYTVGDMAYLPPLDPNYRLSEAWEFELIHCFYGFIIGIISGVLCLIQLIAVGVCKQMFIRLRTRCDSTRILSGTIIAPTVGGLIIGLIYWTLPMTVGDGNLVSGKIIGFSAMGNPLDDTLLVRCAFAKMFCLAISMNCGMIGGFIFPMLTVGIMFAAVAFSRYPDIPILLFVSCFIVGLPSGICPMPFTLLCLPVTLFFVGLEQTAPVFVCAITSYMVVCGSGLFAAIASRGIKKGVSQAEDSRDYDALGRKEKERLEAREFS
jgi:H+/Cl- antiporter ClcA